MGLGVEPATATQRTDAVHADTALNHQRLLRTADHGKPTAVLQDVHSYQRQQRALHPLEMLAQGEHDHEDGRLHDNVLDPRDVATEMAAALAQERAYFEFRHRLASGEVRDVDVYSGPVTVDGRTLLYSVIHDATARRAATAALQQSEAFATAIIDHLTVGIAVVDPQGGLVRVNQALCDLLGLSESQLLGQNYLGLTHPQDRAATMREAQRLWAQEIPVYRMEKRYLRADGATALVQAASTLLRDADGEVYGQLGIVHDITAHREAERRTTWALDERRAAEQRVDLLLRHADDLVIVRDPAGSVAFASAAIDRVIGCTATAVLGADVLELFHRGDRGRVTRLLSDAHAAPGSPHDADVRGASNDGTGRHLRMVATHLSATSTATAHTVCNIRDARDPLTGLATRALSTEWLDRTRDGRAIDGAVALFLVDLDGLATVNEIAGRTAGDAVLRQTAERLRARTTEDDLVVRVAGDKFAVALRDVRSSTDTATIADRYRRALNAPTAWSTAGGSLSPPASAWPSPTTATPHTCGEMQSWPCIKPSPPDEAGPSAATRTCGATQAASWRSRRASVRPCRTAGSQRVGCAWRCNRSSIWRPADQSPSRRWLGGPTRNWETSTPRSSFHWPRSRA